MKTTLIDLCKENYQDYLEEEFGDSEDEDEDEDDTPKPQIDINEFSKINMMSYIKLNLLEILDDFLNLLLDEDESYGDISTELKLKNDLIKVRIEHIELSTKSKNSVSSFYDNLFKNKSAFEILQIKSAIKNNNQDFLKKIFNETQIEEEDDDSDEITYFFDSFPLGSLDQLKDLTRIENSIVETIKKFNSALKDEGSVEI